MADKHPVSQLQEIMARAHKNPPVYEMLNASHLTGNKFICIVSVDGIVARAAGSSKQNAKTDAAKEALEKIGNINNNKVIESPNTVLSTQLTYNAVGKLNEFTAQKKYALPKYNECGVTEKNEFIIRCVLGEYTTEGKGLTKKVAKQWAAHNMFEIVENKILPVPVNVPELNTTLDSKYIDEVIIKRYQELSCRNETPQTVKITVQPVEQQAVPIIENSNQQTEQEMVQELADRNILYDIEIIQRLPFILVLKIHDDKKTTLMETGDTYVEAYLNLLRMAVKVVRNL